MPSEVSVVVTGGDFQALGVLRVLAGHGIPVVVLDSELGIARYSRYKHLWRRSPPPAQEQEFVQFLLRLGREKRISGSLLLPNSDEAVYAISRNKTALAEFYKVPTPGWEITQKVYIKRQTYEIARSIGVPVPRLVSAANLQELLAQDLQYPLVLKPSIRDHLYSKVKIKGFRVDNHQQLVRAYRKICRYIAPAEVIVQDFIPGGPKNLYSFCPFFREGRAVAYITARRARQHPMDFGHASTFAEIVDCPQLASLGERFLRAIGYYGIAEVEFMYDTRDGSYKLIEVNPRVWGWHTLAASAGINLVYLLYRDMLGQEAPLPNAAKRAKWMRLITDVPTIAREILRGKMSLLDYFASLLGGARDAVFSLKDPLPFAVELALLPYLWLKRGF